MLFNSGQIDVNELRQRRAIWLGQPFQPDVADYFLAGPGGNGQPFAAFLAATCA